MSLQRTLLYSVFIRRLVTLSVTFCFVFIRFTLFFALNETLHTLLFKFFAKYFLFVKFIKQGGGFWKMSSYLCMFKGAGAMGLLLCFWGGGAGWVYSYSVKRETLHILSAMR